MAARNQRRRQLPLGDVSDPRGLPALGLAFIDHQKASGFARATLQNRRMYLRLFIAFCEDRGIDRPVDVTRAHLEAYQRHVLRSSRKSDGRPLSTSSMVGRLVTIKGFFSWLTREGHLLLNPASELVLPKASKTLPRVVLDVHQVEAVLSVPDIDTPLGLRDRAILEVLYSTGMRRKELMQLRISDISAERGVVFIKDGKGKKDRVVPIGERALVWLEKYLVEARPWLFQFARDDEQAFDVLFLSSWGGPLAANSVSLLCRKYLATVGVSAGAAHVFRHTMATLMLERGADVRFLQAILGHAQLSTTEVYTRVSIEKLKEVHQLTHPARLPEHVRKELLR